MMNGIVGLNRTSQRVSIHQRTVHGIGNQEIVENRAAEIFDDHLDRIVLVQKRIGRLQNLNNPQIRSIGRGG